jgi:hypothetical protein
MELLEMTTTITNLSGWAGIPLMIFGLLLCLAGRFFIRFIVAIAVFIPVFLTSNLLTGQYGGLEGDDAMVAGIVLGLIAAGFAASLYSRIHIFLAGVFGLILMSVILGFVNSFYNIEGMIYLLVLDLGFIIGAKLFRHMEDELHYTAPSAVGGLLISAGYSLWTVAANELSEFEPFGTVNSIILFVAMMGGAFFQMWMWGEGGYFERWKEGGGGLPSVRR